MSVTPDTPFDEEGWNDSVSDIITLRKRVRALELAVVGDSNDLNKDALAVNQATKTNGGLSAADVQSLINASAKPFMGFWVGGVTATIPFLPVDNLVDFSTGALSFDTNNGFNSTTNLYTIPATGIWMLNASCYFQGGAGNSAGILQVFQNGFVTALQYAQINIAGVAFLTPATISTPIKVLAGDTFGIYLQKPAGTMIANGITFSMYRLS